jgi:hypothetical protein
MLLDFQSESLIVKRYGFSVRRELRRNQMFFAPSLELGSAFLGRLIE